MSHTRMLGSTKNLHMPSLLHTQAREERGEQGAPILICSLKQIPLQTELCLHCGVSVTSFLYVLLSPTIKPGT